MMDGVMADPASHEVCVRGHFFFSSVSIEPDVLQSSVAMTLAAV